MKTLTTILVLILTFTLFGQDVTSYGGIIYPTKKTKISIEKKNLSFTVRDEIAFVDVLYEFNNPETKAQKLVFEYRVPAQFNTYESKNTCQLKDFTLVQDEKIIPYKLKVALDEGKELIDPNDPKIEDGGYGDFVFLFEITFKPGKSTLQHSFNFLQSGDADIAESYHYSMNNDEMWANGTIKELVVTIDRGPNQYFFVQHLFEKTADWSIIGTGKVSEAVVEYFGEEPTKFIRTLSGKVQIKATNFQSSELFHFGKIHSYFFTSNLGDFDDMDVTKSELRILRNTIYAQHGYVFSSADLKKHFNQFAWYMPNPSIKMEDIKLSKKEQELLAELLDLEKK